MTKRAEKKRYKIEVQRSDGQTYDIWSLGYPSLESARAAVRQIRLGMTQYKFRVAEMTTADYAILADLEQDERKVTEKGWTP